MNESITNRDGSMVVTVDHGDGTGTRVSYAPDGTVTATESLTGLPIEVSPVDPVVALATALLDAQSLEEVRQAAQAALDAAGVSP